MIGKVSAADVVALRKAGKADMLEHPETMVRVIPVVPNPFRQYCKARGLTGKMKKKVRKELAARERARQLEASAKLASAEQLTQGGLVNVAQAPRL